MSPSGKSEAGSPRVDRRGATTTRSVFAVLLGFAATAVLVMLTTALAELLFGEPVAPSPDAPARGSAFGYLSANLVGSLLSAVSGGWLAARIAGRRAVEHAMALAIVILVVSLFSLRPGPGQPAWYPYAQIVLESAGALLGGMIRRRTSASVVRARDA